jgi:ribosomal protein S18 acetylase RimI-like enzyme
MEIKLATLTDIATVKTFDKHISKQELENIIKLNRLYILEDESKFIGWLRYNLFWDNTPFMNMIYLLEEYRRKGFGKKLVLFWEEQMKNLGYGVVMTSTASDEYAQHFYNNLGYLTVGGFLPNNEPYEIILQKTL